MARVMSEFEGSSGASSFVPQKTLKSSIDCRGVGLHSGVACTMTLRPAPANHGIVFRRTDVTDRDSLVPALWRNVLDARMCTTVTNAAGVSVSTIEHLMAALAGCEIDNLLIDIDGPEVPIMDGSAEPFVMLIQSAGIEALDAPKRAIRVLKPVRAADEQRSIELRPDNAFSIRFEIEFNSPAIREKELDVRLVNGTFNHTISGARTFGFVEEIEKLRAAGLGRGGSLENVVIVDGDRVLNEGGLRYDDEFVRHKILDCVGDLYLAGAPLLGRVDAVKSGHLFNNKVLRALFADDEAWEWVDLTSEKSARPTTAPALAATA